jgi:hypothetical protein
LLQALRIGKDRRQGRINRLGNGHFFVMCYHLKTFNALPNQTRDADDLFADIDVAGFEFGKIEKVAH